MMRHLIIIMVSITLLTGCSLFTGGKTSSSYPYAVAWNDILYGLSTAEIPLQDIGKEIGKIKRIKMPMPKRNGDSNDSPVGSLLFEVKGTDAEEVIAVKVNDKYFRATKLGPLE
ncbi:MAG: hypothetical protein K6T94_17285 [Paenibacillus sp.]|nr:hypothetical protein [Paenibacillus sp.]